MEEKMKFFCPLCKVERGLEVEMKLGPVRKRSLGYVYYILDAQLYCSKNSLHRLEPEKYFNFLEGKISQIRIVSEMRERTNKKVAKRFLSSLFGKRKRG